MSDYISDKQRDEILQVIKDCGRIIVLAHDIEARDGSITVKPGAANFVTEFDVRVQNTLIERLSAVFPDAYFFAEEKDNAARPQQGYCFYIDPIDGTTNFIHDMKLSAISVALFYGQTPVFGAVYDPYRGEMFSAVWGEGAFLNGRRITVSARTLDKALIAFGTAPYYRDNHVEERFQRIRRVFLACADLRRSGSAALDVCWVACGRTDAYFEDVLSPWDFAAGEIILTEAGGKLSSYDGGLPEPGKSSSVLCSNKTLHEEMLRLLNQ